MREHFFASNVMKVAVASLTALSFGLAPLAAFAQEPQPSDDPHRRILAEDQAPPEEEGPPPDEGPIPPAYARPGEQPPPPPGYGPPPPGYGPDPYNYGVPQGTPGPEVIDDWEEGDPIPPGYKPDTRIRRGLVIGGAVTLGALWIVNVLVASIIVSVEEEDDEDLIDDTGSDPEDFYPLYIPAAGPFITIATAEANGAGTAILIIDGVAQCAGLAMLIAGLAAQEDVLVRTYADNQKIQVTPVVAKEMTGVGVLGTF